MHKVIGFRNVDFTAKETGERISGVRLFLTYFDDHITGEGCENIFLGNNKLKAMQYVPCVGDQVQLFYNRYGKVDNIQLIKHK